MLAVAANGSGLNEGAIKSTSLSPATNDCKMNETNINHYTALSFKPMLAAAASVTLATMQTVVIKFFERGKLNH